MPSRHSASGPPRPRRPRVRSTADRLIDAAERIFARDGLEAATTRAIAREAGCNEVTLFRHFGTKDGVLAAVVSRTSGIDRQPSPVPDTGDLRADLTGFARHYVAALRGNIHLIRTFIGDIHRHREYERSVLHSLFQPLRTGLIARLEKAGRAGELRAEVTAEIAADLFSGMIFTGVLREVCSLKTHSYTAEQYLQGCVSAVWAVIAAGRTSSS